MPDLLFNTEPTMSPIEMASLTGVAPDMLRDWRRRGYIEKFGTAQGNGRWLYDWGDAFLLCNARSIYESGVDLPPSIRASVTVGRHILLAAFSQRCFYSDPNRYRFFRMYRYGDVNDPVYGGWATQPIRELPKDATKSAMILIDVDAIARVIPSAFNRKIEALHLDIAKESKEGKAD